MLGFLKILVKLFPKADKIFDGEKIDPDDDNLPKIMITNPKQYLKNEVTENNPKS